jgi:hypothetical protein
MSLPRVTPDDLETWRRELYCGRRLEPAAARRLMDELERLQDELAQARTTFARKAAAALERRLQVVATFNRGGCPSCRDAEARAFLAKLQRIATETTDRKPSR